MILRHVIVPVLLMALAVLSMLASLGSKKDEHKILYALLMIAVLMLLLFDVAVLGGNIGGYSAISLS